MDILDRAMERLKVGEQTSLTYYGKPLMICYSGGKDSDVLIELAKTAKINFEVVHSHTTADAPETVRTFFIGHPSYKGNMPHLEMIRTNKHDIPIDDFGKRVFLTKEAAETALKK